MKKLLKILAFSALAAQLSAVKMWSDDLAQRFYDDVEEKFKDATTAAALANILTRQYPIVRKFE
jgi:hypothetical protein